MDAYVRSTSTTDGFGLSVAEAIAAGIPVVSSPVGIASRSGLAIIVPIDASQSEWAAAIVSSDRLVLPMKDLFPRSDHLAVGTSVVHIERKANSVDVQMEKQRASRGLQLLPE